MADIPDSTEPTDAAEPVDSPEPAEYSDAVEDNEAIEPAEAEESLAAEAPAEPSAWEIPPEPTPQPAWAAVPQPVRPVRPMQPHASRPLPPPRRPKPIQVAQSGGSVKGWVGVGLAACAAVGSLFYAAPWKQTAHQAPPPAPVDEAIAAVPPAALPTPTPLLTKAPEPEPLPPATKPQNEVEKWLTETDAKQQALFQVQVLTPFETGKSDLQARYLASLYAGQARISAAGQLEEAVLWRAERGEFELSKILADDTATTPPGIRALRAEYRQSLAALEQQRTARAQLLHASYDAALAKYVTLLTQRQRLDDALMVKSKREEVAKAWGIVGTVKPAPPPPVATPIPQATPGVAQGTGRGISLLDLPRPKEREVGYGKLVFGGSNFLGDRVLVDGVKCTQWIGAHASSKMVYPIPFGTKAFSAIGVRTDGNRSVEGSWRYIVRVDDREVFQSKALSTYPNFQVPIEISISLGAKSIELSIDEMGSIRNDHSVWALPVFRK